MKPTPPRCAMCGCSWKGGTSDLARDLRARMREAAEDMRFEEAAAPARSALHRGRDGRSARRWPPPKATTSTSSAYYAEPPLVAVNLFHLRNGQIVDRREYLLGGPVRFRAPRILLLAAASRSIWTSSTFPPTSTCRWISKIARRWKNCSRRTRPQGGDPHAAARAEEGAARSGGDQREAQLRRAFPRA